MSTTPSVILILKQRCLRARLRWYLAQMTATTWWREFKEKSPTAPWKVFRQEKTPTENQPQFRCENTLATIEPDQILLALQQLTNYSISANFNKNFHRISKLPKSRNTTMPTRDVISDKFELFEGLFQTSLRIHNHITNWLKNTESITSALSWKETRYKVSKTLTAQPEKVWEKSF